jgi:hypothetical protein
MCGRGKDGGGGGSWVCDSRSVVGTRLLGVGADEKVDGSSGKVSREYDGYEYDECSSSSGSIYVDTIAGPFHMPMTLPFRRGWMKLPGPLYQSNSVDSAYSLDERCGKLELA